MALLPSFCHSSPLCAACLLYTRTVTYAHTHYSLSTIYCTVHTPSLHCHLLYVLPLPPYFHFFFCLFLLSSLHAPHAMPTLTACPGRPPRPAPHTTHCHHLPLHHAHSLSRCLALASRIFRRAYPAPPRLMPPPRAAAPLARRAATVPAAQQSWPTRWTGRAVRPLLPAPSPFTAFAHLSTFHLPHHPPSHTTHACLSPASASLPTRKAPRLPPHAAPTLPLSSSTISLPSSSYSVFSRGAGARLCQPLPACNLLTSAACLARACLWRHMVAAMLRRARITVPFLYTTLA